ncbi:hypothetical protein Cob_v007710 [Colletotrichum orbiculare MAFF 240422]|uniref:Uncharacterized protein n=1 Tax=Colletotrichum orbiculare (strain 104-T / ATCC 96160 / CBS 514.97 / LARS 414 / MAFF 240422) TaxID=1213857 RepID=A0A484FNF6_COLOR|nr:hypothetical protein Cob_v007710 [Colletotrichum orbiculare MAFF 240422]
MVTATSTWTAWNMIHDALSVTRSGCDVCFQLPTTLTSLGDGPTIRACPPADGTADSNHASFSWQWFYD